MINANNSIITVISTLVGQMTPLCTIDTNAASGTNWQLDMCATFWLNVGSIVTIGGVDFTVESYVKNVSITVSGAAQPIGATFNLTAPVFSHGSHRKVEGERQAPTDLSLPFVYLPVPEVTESNDVNDDIAYTAKINPIFLIEFDPDNDEIDLQQAEIIEPCNEMADFFAWLIEDQQENFERPEGLTRKEWMNFGDPTTWGNDKLIFDQNLSGVELRMSLEVSYDAPCLCASVDPVICAPVTETWNGATITPVASGGTKDVLTVDAADGVTPVGTKTVDNSGALTIEVSVGGDPVDTDFNGTPTGVTTPGGDNLDIDVKGSDASNVGTLGTNTANIKQIDIADSRVSNSDDTYDVDVVSEDPLELPDITHTQTDGSPETLPAQTPLVCTPVAAAINTANLYKTGVVTSYRTGDDGDLEEGRGTDWFNLGYNTDWGHGFRFVGNTGGYTDGTNYFDKDGVSTTYALAFPNDECCDWAYYDQVNGTVPMWYLVSFGTTTPSPVLPRGGQVSGTSVNTAIDNALASTQNGHSDWYLPNANEWVSILDWKNGINLGNGLAYKPFEFTWTGGTPSSTGSRCVTSSAATGGLRYLYWIVVNGILAPISPTSSLYTYFIKRNALLTEFTF